MTKVLVVYYSRTGHTRTVAQLLASTLGADVEAIEEDAKSARRNNVWAYLKSALEAAFRLKVSLRPPRHDASQYDLVLIGTPIWFWSVSSPVRAYIARYRGDFRRVAFFCTCGGAGQSKVFEELERLSGKMAVAGCAVREAEIANQQYIGKVAEFAARLEKTGAIKSPSPREGSAAPPLANA